MKVVVQDFMGFMNELNLKHFVEALYTQLSTEVENPNFMMSLPEILKVIVSLSEFLPKMAFFYSLLFLSSSKIGQFHKSTVNEIEEMLDVITKETRLLFIILYPLYRTERFLFLLLNMI